MFHSNSKFRGKVFTKRPCSKCQPQKLKQKQKQKIILKAKFINKSEKERRKEGRSGEGREKRGKRKRRRANNRK